MYKIAICAGHGFNTPGKRTPDGEREWSFNNKLVVAFVNTMNQYENVTVKRYDDPTGKTDVPLITRTNGANAWGANIYISFHHNANTAKWGTWTGVETFYYPGSTTGLNLAKAIHPAVVQSYGLKDRGVKSGNLHIVRETKMPAILIEGGFMDSTIDIKKLRSDAVLKAAGENIAHAVAKYAGLKKKSSTSTPKPPTPTTPNAATYTVVKGDTLYGISQKFGISVDTIKSLNGLKTNTISIGQVLKVKK
ncbi:endolysin [Bacillus phage G]|nr:endolysin [Bacillus phage G]AEO93293.1 gp22 [Bacillus phage G]